eukprot:scaffold1911_cov181-Isochrysis_galbana.AAC.3
MVRVGPQAPRTACMNEGAVLELLPHKVDAFAMPQPLRHHACAAVSCADKRQSDKRQSFFGGRNLRQQPFFGGRALISRLVHFLAGVAPALFTIIFTLFDNGSK